ncbi:MAG: chromosome segregation SMC family protein [Candidatus Omnitrophota bacterium]
MYFKKLELIGFKSFSDKTVIHFESGVTAIVGPNGCGKSNISDAIRWSLGEQSAKSLRGSSMEDIIFSGSNLKEPLNLAEVSLTLSNESKILPIDYEEVTITRRLYRSGESEYLINKNTVRLKDIHEMLMGTGIGTECYSIIEQGKMDVILNSKPEDRREIFEEAAGITKFKSKKKEALRKLEQTEINLTRINDIIAEVKRQIGSIERQAKKAEAYKREFEKLKELELAVASREFLIFEDRKRSREENFRALKAEEERCLELTRSFENTYEAKRSELERLENALRELQSEELASASGMRANQDRSLLNRERIGELAARRENLLKQGEAARKRLSEFEAEARRLEEDFAASQREEHEGRAFLGSVEAEFAAIDGAIRQAQAEGQSARNELFDRANKRAHLQSEIAKLRAQTSALSMGLRKLKREEESLLQEIRDFDAALNPPLFAGDGGQPAAARFEARVAGFKEKIWGIFRSLFEGRRTAPGPEEDAALDAEIKSFNEEAVRIHGQVVEEQSRRSHVEAAKKKVEEKLSVISMETQELLSEENALRAREKEIEDSVALWDAEEKALNERFLSGENLARDKQNDKETALVRLAETRSMQNHFTARREKIEKDRNWLLQSKGGEEAALASFEREAQESIGRQEALEAENAGLERESGGLSRRRDEVLKAMEGLRRDRAAVMSELAALEHERQERHRFLDEARQKLHAYELENTEIRYEIDRLKERIFNAYQVDLVAESAAAWSTGAPGEEETVPAFDLEEAKAQIQGQKDKLNKMGPVNLVAIEEHDEMKERFDFLTKQHGDLVQAKDDLHKAIQKINRTTRELFIETFQQIQKHFNDYYRQLFGGGSAELILLDESDVLESGIEIVARPPGKKLQNISLLSGGEKALTAIALLFSLFKVKPSPFCVLDEIDAPLDESNVDRFCRVLKEFIAESQFILITHNKRTMNLADALYGITMAETGVSKVVSVRISENASQNGNSKEKREVLV